MVPSLSDLNVFLILLLPGILAYKTRRLFFPQIPSNKPDSFDKIAVYFLLTIITYGISFPSFIILKLTSTNNASVIFNYLIVSIVALLLGISSSVIQIYFSSSQKLKNLRGYIYQFISPSGSLWYRVFTIDLRETEIKENKKLIIEVTIYMQKGEVFIGELYAYPVEDNIEDTKDFILKGVTQVYSDGRVREYPSDFALILNQRDVEKIIYHYTPKEDKIPLKSAIGFIRNASIRKKPK